MLLPLDGRNLAYDLAGPEDAPVVCITHSLALAHGDRLLSALWSDTLPASPAGAAEAWRQRMATVRDANSLAPIADGTMERWFTDAFKPRRPERWRQIRDTIAGTTPAGYLGCAAAILDFDFRSCRRSSCRYSSCAAPKIRARRPRKTAASPGSYPARATKRSPLRGTSPMSSGPRFNRTLLDWLEAQRSRR